MYGINDQTHEFYGSIRFSVLNRVRKIGHKISLKHVVNEKKFILVVNQPSVVLLFEWILFCFTSQP